VRIPSLFIFSFLEAFQKPEDEPRVVRFREHPHLGGRIDRVAGGRESPCRRRPDVRNTSHRCTYARGSTGILHITDESDFRAVVRVVLRQPSPPFCDEHRILTNAFLSSIHKLLRGRINLSDHFISLVLSRNCGGVDAHFGSCHNVERLQFTHPHFPALTPSHTVTRFQALKLEMQI
jgi:hypothetical protein